MAINFVYKFFIFRIRVLIEFYHKIIGFILIIIHFILYFFQYSLNFIKNNCIIMKLDFLYLIFNLIKFIVKNKIIFVQYKNL